MYCKYLNPNGFYIHVCVLEKKYSQYPRSLEFNIQSLQCHYVQIYKTLAQIRSNKKYKKYNVGLRVSHMIMSKYTCNCIH